MKRQLKLLLLAVVLTSFLAFMPMDTDAAAVVPLPIDTWSDDDIKLDVIIVDAYYTDFDGDGKEDDIITVFRVVIDNDDDNSFLSKVKVDCKITTPSGDSYKFKFDEYTQNGFVATLVWLNTANEPGWYDFGISSSISKEIKVNDELTFDPPGGGDKGELPAISIDSIEHF